MKQAMEGNTFQGGSDPADAFPPAVNKRFMSISL